MHHEGALEQSYSKAPTNHKNHIKNRKGCETWKKDKPRKTLACNDSAFQNKGGLSFLQSYQHPLHIDITQNN